MPTTFDTLSLVAVLASAGAAAAVDLRTRRIPNAITMSTALVGIVAAATGVSELGVTASLLGLVLGGLAMMPGHLFGATGAGDLKLLAAIGTWLGPGPIIRAFFYTTLAGGLLALAFALYRGRLGRTLGGTIRLVATPAAAKREIAAPAAGNRFPYGPAIATGCLLVAFGY